MQELTNPQRAYLRKLANPLGAAVMLGKQGLTEQIIQKIHQELDAHELIKVRFIDHKEERQSLTETIVSETDSALIGLIGNVAILYREQADRARRKITLPE